MSGYQVRPSLARGGGRMQRGNGFTETTWHFQGAADYGLIGEFGRYQEHGGYTIVSLKFHLGVRQGWIYEDGIEETWGQVITAVDGKVDAAVR